MKELKKLNKLEKLYHLTESISFYLQSLMKFSDSCRKQKKNKRSAKRKQKIEIMV